ncbi:MAG: thymidine phosphorylase [Lachnospiraceae bacterium]|nr:thymidine phosphorylase [Lachnospiraceae bacterium]
MLMYNIIDKKKKGGELTREETEYFVNGYVKGDIPDYQISALLMAIYYKGMSDTELLNLTDIMAESGDMADLSGIDGIKADKHSTGGVGDKTTIAVAPVVAACGVKVAKMSGRGLGFTGGTIDKLESIPGFKTSIPKKEFFNIVNSIGLSVIGQSGEIAPADKKLYALRDVTATVDSIPLIAASIMSKKLAAGSDKIVLDVTTGTGAFMKSIDDAVTLAKKMVAIGEGAGRETVAYITNMNVPLGIAAGNNIEVIEAIETLKGNGPEDFTEICRNFSASMLNLAGKGSMEECILMADKAIENHSALDKLAEMVKMQGGDERYIYDTSLFKKAPYSYEWISESDMYITQMDTEQCGKTSVLLGAGREIKDSVIDFTAGIKFYKKTGDYVKKGDIIAVLYSSDKEKLNKAAGYLKQAYKTGRSKVEKQKTIIAYVSKNNVIMY